jgi:hypothetical protein
MRSRYDVKLRGGRSQPRACLHTEVAGLETTRDTRTVNNSKVHARTVHESPEGEVHTHVPGVYG